jgi:hypothetical protein
MRSLIAKKSKDLPMLNEFSPNPTALAAALAAEASAKAERQVAELRRTIGSIQDHAKLTQGAVKDAKRNLRNAQKSVQNAAEAREKFNRVTAYFMDSTVSVGDPGRRAIPVLYLLDMTSLYEIMDERELTQEEALELTKVPEDFKISAPMKLSLQDQGYIA